MTLPSARIDDPVVGDGDPVRVAGQILENMLWATERWLGIDDPVLAKQGTEKGAEGFVLRQWFEPAGQAELAPSEGALEAGDELAAKHAAEDLHWQEEGIAWMDPALVVGRQTAGGDHAVDVRMMQEILPPGVEHAEKADVGAEMFGIGGDLQQRGGAGAEQEAVETFLFCNASARVDGEA